ncbi:MAG: NitT/TauT family transport system permease protein [Acidobacteriota bacterium]|jgi:NitT/TauT family transport system permease protein|nr:NitT/TauT family transport system permease protein [Acidobacteriota bacterium]
MKSRLEPIFLPFAVAVVFVLGWHFAVKTTGSDIFPTPKMVVTGTVELARKGVLFKYVVASLFRVTTGYLLAVFIGIPLGLLMGWFGRARLAFNPAIQVLRPISPIAWIPIAILWFGVSDLAPIFLIFLASLFPITTAAMAAVQNIQLVYIRAARNFGITGLALFKKVVFPAALPQILTGLRLALGVAWLVVVAAEMIAVNSGLGYLIIDARNAGKRYDLVVAGMVLIGLIGLGLDYLVRRMEHLDQVRWGLSRHE